MTLRLLFVLAGIAAIGPGLAAQSPVLEPRFVFRADIGSLNPDDPFTVTLAYGAQFGWELHGRSVAVISGTRQELSRDIVGPARDDLRTYLGLGYEHYLGTAGLRRQQWALRGDVGAVFRSGFDAKPFFAGGVSIRYPLSRRTAFIGTLKDIVALLPGGAEHNFGIFISLELRQ